MTSELLEDHELGDIVPDNDTNKSRWMLVQCFHLESQTGCGARRWAKYYGPSRGHSKNRLCEEHALVLARRQITSQMSKRPRGAFL